MVVDILRVDLDTSRHEGIIICAFEGNIFEQSLHNGVQPSSTDILGSLIDLPSNLGNPSDAIDLEIEFDALSLQQCLILLR